MFQYHEGDLLIFRMSRGLILRFKKWWRISRSTARIWRCSKIWIKLRRYRAKVMLLKEQGSHSPKILRTRSTLYSQGAIRLLLRWQLSSKIKVSKQFSQLMKRKTSCNSQLVSQTKSNSLGEIQPVSMILTLQIITGWWDKKSIKT